MKRMALPSHRKMRLALAQELIRKLDEESTKKLEQVSPEEKAAEPDAA